MTLYDLAGGHDRLLAMTTAFYGKAIEDDVIGPMFGKAASEHAAYLASWLSASFGGPRDYLTTRGDLRFVIWKHAGLKITEAQRARWARLMMDAAVEVGMTAAFLQSYERFVDAITHSTRENSNFDPEVLRTRLGYVSDEPVVPLGLQPSFAKSRAT